MVALAVTLMWALRARTVFSSLSATVRIWPMPLPAVMVTAVVALPIGPVKKTLAIFPVAPVARMSPWMPAAAGVLAGSATMRTAAMFFAVSVMSPEMEFHARTCPMAFVALLYSVPAPSAVIGPMMLPPIQVEEGLARPSAWMRTIWLAWMLGAAVWTWVRSPEMATETRVLARTSGSEIVRPEKLTQPTSRKTTLSSDQA